MDRMGIRFEDIDGDFLQVEKLGSVDEFKFQITTSDGESLLVVLPLNDLRQLAAWIQRQPWRKS